MTNYISLHNHSDYSIQESTIRVNELVNFAVRNKMPAIALTEHGNMYSAIEFSRLAKQRYIKPIFGCEFYRSDLSHMVLLAKDAIGYSNLMKIVSNAYGISLNGKHSVDDKYIKEYHEGLICLHGCWGTERENFEKYAKELQDIFKSDYYIELQNYTFNSQQNNENLIKIADKLGVKPVITNPSYYSNKEDIIIQQGLFSEHSKSIYQISESGESYLKPEQDLRKSFAWMSDEPFKEYITNTEVIANKCNVELKLERQPLTKFDTPEGYTSNSYLRELVNNGLNTRYEEVQNEVQIRAELELAIIEELGVADYFLMVWDIIQYAKSQNLPIGTGRGASPCSLIVYALGICDINPMKYNLPLERFFTPILENQIPDIDIDLGIDAREKIIKYVQSKYGKDRTSLITVFSRYPDRSAQRLAQLIAKTTDKFTVDELTKKIKGLKYAKGIHSAGIVIAPKPINEIMPVHQNLDKIYESGFDRENVEALGLIKLDFIGLAELDHLQNTIKLIKEVEPDFNINKIPLDDKETYKMLSEGICSGVYQFKSDEMKDLVIRLQPSCFEDLMGIISLYRPMPIKKGDTYEFIRNKHNKKELLSGLQTILGETYGVIVYQEQVIDILKLLTNSSKRQAESLRRMILSGRLMEMTCNNLTKGATKYLGLNKDDAVKFVKKVIDSIDYTFNKSHAAAYALISYQEAYLQRHYLKYYNQVLTEYGKKTKLDRVQRKLKV